MLVVLRVGTAKVPRENRKDTSESSRVENGIVCIVQVVNKLMLQKVDGCALSH